ncbi:hypothetical protein [Spongiactinospora sp. TRM90649]|uniref:hypothetical protein n=1 Tax=Spongiactinospora sp. TRM90649 TaxID=3031114 RepID=UPI0023F98310|nr:hypothetical protein [Spongiactinospora sp. TRM90649]MDF5758535.1 hypothetical protein [Spongiactinospora sp. TRM90649]
MSTWRASDGTEVKVVVVNDRPCLRICRWRDDRRTLIGYYADVRDVARHVNLADLVQV